MKTPERTTADGLRALADFLDANQEIKPGSHDILVCLSNHPPDEQRAKLAEAARRYGPLEKRFDQDMWAYLVKNFGGGVTISWFVRREAVCRKVVTGKRTVSLPAEEAKPARTVEIEDTKWECEPILRPVPEDWQHGTPPLGPESVDLGATLDPDETPTLVRTAGSEVDATLLEAEHQRALRESAEERRADDAMFEPR
jgi:hypothetical protein